MKNNFLKEEKTILIFAIIALLSFIYLSSKTCAVWEECQDDSECGQYQSCDGGYCTYYTGASECLFDSAGKPFCQFYKTKGYPGCEKDSDCGGGGGGCDCGSWTDQSCGGGACADYLRYQTRSCTPALCDYETQCAVDPSCECDCGSWVNQGCGEGNCGSCQKYYTRNCNPNGCASETKCSTPSYGSCVYENECSTTGSKSNSCGCTKTCTRTVSLPYTSGGNEKINGEEIYCLDTLDNDCDNFIDYEDPDCPSADVIAVSNFYNKGVPVVLLNLTYPPGFTNGKLTLSVHDEDDVLRGSCSQDISLSNKLFFGTAIKDAHFYLWAESALLTDDEIAECQKSGMGSYMDDDCKHHDCTDESFNNYGEDDFYKKYSSLKILENTPNYLQGPDFVRREMPECESLFRSLDVGFYELTASLGVIP